MAREHLPSETHSLPPDFTDFKTVAAGAAIAGTAAAAAYIDGKYHVRHDLSSGSLSNATKKAQNFIIEREATNRLLLYHCLEDHARNQPSNLFLEYDGRSWTYKQFYADLQRVGNCTFF